MLNRRSFLLRSAAIGAGTVVPIAAEATLPEDAEILALEHELNAAVRVCLRAAAALAAAQKLFTETRPIMPRGTIAVRLRMPELWRHGDWQDAFGGQMDGGQIVVRYVTPAAIARELRKMDGRTTRARMLKSVLPTVQRYEDEEEAALQASGVIGCEDDLYEARRDLLRIGEEIFKREAKGSGGVAVMARAIGAVAHLGVNDRFVTLRWGPKLAENVLRQEAHR